MARSATAPARRLGGGGKVLNLLLSVVLTLGLMPALALGGAQEAHADDAPAGAVEVEIKELPGGTVELIDGIPDQPNNVTDLKPGGRAFFRITANTEAGYSVSTSGQGRACLNWSSNGGETWQRASWGYNGYGRIDLPADCSKILVKGGFNRSAVTVSVGEGASGGTVEVRGLYDADWSGGPLTVYTWAGAFYAKAEPAEGFELKSLTYTQSDGSVVSGEDMSSQGEEYANVWKFPIPEEYLDGTVTAEFREIGAVDGTIVREVETGEGNVATITAGGTYHLVEGASGTVKVATTEAVTLVGNGAVWDENYKITSTSNDVLVDCTSQPGVSVTLKDIYFHNMDRGAVDVTGSGNTLNFEGTSIIDYQPQLSYGHQPAAIHVGVGSSLTIGGTGTLYLYKFSSGAGIGGGTADDSSEMNGSITLAVAQLFAKGSKQGALIGSGEGAKGTGSPGSITFESGEYNLLSVSRGAVVGGAAGRGGAAGGTTVTVKPQANVNINIDFSGSAIGGGGYDSGNDSDGGTLYMAGGSLRTYIDTNAANNASATWTAGANDDAITAVKLDGAGDLVYKCVFDTSMLQVEADQFTVNVDGELLYQGGLHKYGYVNEANDKNVQISITSTPANWCENGETNLYFYLPEGAHTLTVNGEEFYAVYDQELQDAQGNTAGAFAVGKKGSAEDAEYDLAGIAQGHGKVSFQVGGKEATRAHAGERVKIVTTPDSDEYMVSDGPTVRSDEPVEVSNGWFTMPSSSILARVEFAKAIPVELTVDSKTVGKGGTVLLPVTADSVEALADAGISKIELKVSDACSVTQPPRGIVSDLGTCTVDAASGVCSIEFDEGALAAAADDDALFSVLLRANSSYGMAGGSDDVSLESVTFYAGDKAVRNIALTVNPGTVTVDVENDVEYDVIVVEDENGFGCTVERGEYSVVFGSDAPAGYELVGVQCSWYNAAYDYDQAYKTQLVEKNKQGTFSISMPDSDMTVTPVYEKVVVLGDVNGDGSVNSADAGVLISYCLNEASLGDAALAAADVNGDGSVNSADAGILISYCLNEIDSLG